MTSTPDDPLDLSKALIACASVTPRQAGALDIVAHALEPFGFATRRLVFGETDNLYARLGAQAPHFLFAGHVDVVPAGKNWTSDPFTPEVREGALYGRGAADMKSAIAAMVVAAQRFVAAHGAPAGSLSVLFTSDEEGPGLDGTQRALAALAGQGERFDHCLVGEPTSEKRLGDTIKNGRRGSLNCVLTVQGAQGHVAYPERARNPVTALVEIIGALKARRLDAGAPGFTPSNLEATSIDVGNSAHNVIPAEARAKLNIRFNTAHDGEDLAAWIVQTARDIGARHGVQAQADIAISGRPFYTENSAFTDLVVDAVRGVARIEPQLSTSGGTSDARFIRDFCPVIEFGAINASAHMVDEHIAVEDIAALTTCYEAILRAYFTRNGHSQATG